MAKYICSKLVSVDKLAKTSGLGVRIAKPFFTTDEQYAWLGENFEAQRKYDGCCAVITLFPEGSCYPKPVIGQSRTGEPLLSADFQLDAIRASFDEQVREHGGLVIIAEAWWPGKNEFAKISGAFRKKSEQRPNLHFKINDVFTLKEYQAGKTDIHYYARMGRIEHVCPQPSWSFVQRYAPGSYGDPRDLCATVYAQGGYDGVVLVDPYAGWKLDDGKDGEKLKVKNELSFDLRCTEVHTGVGEKTGRPVYSITVDFKGQPLGVGSGIPHDLSQVPKVGDIVEITAMDYSSDGLLREPRYKGVRHDKLEVDA